MYRCEDCSLLLLDYLYGLLEPEESARLREHLDACPACQQALSSAEAQQNLLTRAAQVITDVPYFHAPTEEAVETKTAETPAVLQAIPMPRRRPLRRWAWLSAAAALLAMVGGVPAFYQQRLRQHEREFAEARQAVLKIDARAAELSKKVETELAAVAVQEKERVLHVQSVSAPNLLSNTMANFKVATFDWRGKPAPADIVVQVRDEATKQILGRQEVFSKGDAEFAVPVDNNTARSNQAVVEISARNSLTNETLRQIVPVIAPEFSTHLVLNKSAYHADEVLFFRSLTVERFSLRPVEGEFSLVYRLVGPSGKVVKQLPARTEHGIGFGEFALTSDLPSGEYTLEVGETNPGKDQRFRPASRRLMVLRDEPPQVLFDRAAYQPGDKVQAAFQGRRDLSKVAANQPITVKANANNQPLGINGSLPGQQIQLRTDGRGKADLQLQLPEKMPTGQAAIEVEIFADKKRETVVQQIPIVPAQVQVQFFPEGGDLVAGAPQRVYFRVRNVLDEPAELEGLLVDAQNREVAKVATANLTLETGRPLGLGVFAFTPQTGQSYRLRVRRPAGSGQVFNLPMAQPSGLVFSVAAGVSLEAEPLLVSIRDTRGPRPLVVVATCRGRVVDQAFVAGPVGQVSLRPPVGGVVRLTVYEQRQDDLLPLAERLVYRAPTERLHLGINRSDGNANLNYASGERADLLVTAVNEKQKATPAWLLAAIVDERSLGLSASTGAQALPAHFYLNGEIQQSEDLEQADVLLTDRPESRQALDLFLGAYGWRRFVFTEAEYLAKKNEKKASGKEDWWDDNHGYGLLVLANARDPGKERFEQVVTQRQTELLTEAAQTRADLAVEKARLLQQAYRTIDLLAEFQRWPRLVLWTSAIVLQLLLIMAGVALLGIGLVRAVTQKRSPRLPLAGSITVFALFLTLYLGLFNLVQPPAVRSANPEAGLLEPWPALPEAPPVIAPPEFEKRKDNGPAVRHLATLSEKLPVKLGDPPAQAQAQLHYAAQADTQAKGEAATRLMYLRQDSASEPAGKDMQGFGGMQRNDRLKAAQNYEQSPGPSSSPGGFGGGGGVKGGGAFKGKAGGDIPATGAVKGDLFAPIDPGKGDRFLMESQQAFRVYAYERPKQGKDFEDTLLWFPALSAPDGNARVQFDLPTLPANYRVLLYGHTNEGRMGMYHGRLEAR